MQFSDDILVRVVVFMLGVCGFLVAKHIYKHKDDNKNPLVCPIKFDCHAVVHSDYSKLFGVPVEILGMIYYAIISISYLFFIFSVEAVPEIFVATVVLLSLIAFIFSVYLIGVQIFILKKGCSWCIVSAFICLCIFILTTLAYDFTSIMQIFL